MRIPYYFHLSLILFVHGLLPGTHQPAHAQSYFKLTPELEKAYESIANLQLARADIQLRQLAAKEPGNMLILYYQDYVDVLSIIISEDKTLLGKLEPNKSLRLSKISDADRDSPYYLLTQAEINLHWALARLKFEEYFTAASEINRCFRLLKKNAREHPDFIYTYRTLGMLKAAVGTLPDKYQWIISLLTSMEGSVEEGLQEVKRAYEQSKGSGDPILMKESGMIYGIALITFENNPQKAWKVIESLSLKSDKSLIDCFYLAHIAMQSGKNNKAIKYLQNMPSGPSYSNFHYLEFLLGEALLYDNDPLAEKHLLKYVHEFKGRYYIKEAYQKLAWNALLHSGEELYKQYMRLAILKGEAVTDEDKHALNKATDGKVPELCLLKARILFDGHYFGRAEQAILQCQLSTLDEAGKLEYTYRRGRIASALGRELEALKYFDSAIVKGKDSPHYFACASALQAGIICEKIGNPARAREYFNRCLQLKPDDYQSSLHQKAKAGLSRVKS